MNEFAYHRAASVADAVERIARAIDGRFLAGGQSLLATMKLGLATPTDLVDLSRMDGLSGIAVGDGTLRIGATTPHATVAGSSEVLALIPALARLADLIGDPAVRARGTLGGSIANNDPAACWPAAVLGLGATVHTDRRAITADEFFTGLYETALAPGELIVAVSFPIPQRAAWVKFRQPASRFSLVGVFVSQGQAGLRVAVTGAGPCVFRCAPLESALTADWSPAAARNVRIAPDRLNTDLHASASYRAHLIPVLAARAVAQAG
ncbi:MAG: xanthine dehydrogenase family protein subunit M [Burkholderiales bacterium]|nr:MAG: xanthine dehydrogenase family protein subunit M [Burkholderiales bacterium]